MNRFNREWMFMECYALIMYLSFISIIKSHTLELREDIIFMHKYIQAKKPWYLSVFFLFFYKSNRFVNRTCRRSTPLYAKHGQMGTVSTEPLVSHIWSLYSKTAKNYTGNHLPAYVQLNEHCLFVWLNKWFPFYKTGY